MTEDQIMHKASHMIDTFLVYHGCPLGKYPEFEYYYCENCLYLVRHKKSHVMLFVDDYSPIEAVETMITIMKEGGIYVD